MTLAFFHIVGRTPVECTVVNNAASHSCPLGPRFLMNSGYMPSSPAAFPDLMVFMAASISCLEYGTANSEEPGNSEMFDASSFLASSLTAFVGRHLDVCRSCAAMAFAVTPVVLWGVDLLPSNFF